MPAGPCRRRASTRAKRHGVRKNTFYVDDPGQTVAAARTHREAIEVEADDGVARPLPPKFERVVKDVSFDCEYGKTDRGRDHFYLTTQSSYSIGERANSHVAAAALLHILRNGGNKSEAATHPGRTFACRPPRAVLAGDLAPSRSP